LVTVKDADIPTWFSVIIFQNKKIINLSKDRTDLNLGVVVYFSIIFHIPVS